MGSGLEDDLARFPHSVGRDIEPQYCGEAAVVALVIGSVAVSGGAAAGAEVDGSSKRRSIDRAVLTGQI